MESIAFDSGFTVLPVGVIRELLVDATNKKISSLLYVLINGNVDIPWFNQLTNVWHFCVSD